jgi:hypothetical protein
VLVVKVRRQFEYGRRIEEKLARVVQACKEIQRPTCTCGRHMQAAETQPRISGLTSEPGALGLNR